MLPRGLAGEQKNRTNMNDTLGHYTNLDAMLNIIQRDGLHFRGTHYTMLNDSLEFKWSFEVLKEKIKDKERLSEEEVHRYYDLFPYVVSLSEAIDDHLLWHLYGKCGYGICMILDRKMLKMDSDQLLNEFNIKRNWHILLNVKYANKYNHLSILDDLKNDYEDEYFESENDDYDNIAVCCAFLKQEDWQCEREVRYAIVRNKIMQGRYDPNVKDKNTLSAFEDTENIRYYARGSELVPYIDVYFPSKALTAIVVGSRLDFEKTKANIKKVLKNLGTEYSHVEVIKSETPF